MSITPMTGPPGDLLVAKQHGAGVGARGVGSFNQLANGFQIWMRMSVHLPDPPSNLAQPQSIRLGQASF